MSASIVASLKGVAGSVLRAAVPPAARAPSLSLIMSKLLSCGVVAGSCVGKLPQVQMIWQAKSAKGVSMMSIWMEAFSMGIQFGYNVVRGTPLTTYAEVPILFAQLLVLVLVAAWVDEYLGPKVWAGCCCLCCVTGAMVFHLVPVCVTAGLYTANAALGVLIVLPQISLNFQNKSTGNLSFTVTSMTWSGMSTRLYTTMVEVDDWILRLTMLVNWSLMSMLMVQFWRYRTIELPRTVPVCPACEPTDVAQGMARIGSSRCMSDLLDEGTMDTTLKKIASLPSMTRIASMTSMVTLPSFTTLCALNEEDEEHPNGTSSEYLYHSLLRQDGHVGGDRRLGGI